MSQQVNLTHVTDLTRFNDLILEDKVTVVDFHATWCGPCKVIAPTFEALSKAHPEANFLKVDVDEASDVSAECGIRAMPTFMVFRKGEKIGEVVGANPAALKAAVSNAIAAWLAGTPVTAYQQPVPSSMEQFINVYGRWIVVAMALAIWYFKKG